MNFSDPAIIAKMAEAAAWCGKNASAEDPRGSTRTPELRPSIMDGTDQEVLDRFLGDFPAVAAAVEHVCRERRAALQRAGMAAVPTAPPPGRVLATDLDTDWCVCAEPESLGFYDSNDIPGWDTWFHCERVAGSTRILLYCLVPPQLVKLANDGLETLVGDFIRWVDADHPYPLAAPPAFVPPTAAAPQHGPWKRWLDALLNR